MAENWILEDDSWKYDVMPEIWEGKNVADFIDPDIQARLEALEAEEEKLEAEGFYDSEEEIVRPHCTRCCFSLIVL
jgi:nucleolar GTP-binding protein